MTNISYQQSSIGLLCKRDSRGLCCINCVRAVPSFRGLPPHTLKVQKTQQVSSHLLWEHVEQRVHKTVREGQYATDLIGDVQLLLCLTVFGFIEPHDEKQKAVRSPADEEGCNDTQHHYYCPVLFSVWSLQNCLQDAGIADDNDSKWEEEKQWRLEIISHINIRTTRRNLTCVFTIQFLCLYRDSITQGCNNADDPSTYTGTY